MLPKNNSQLTFKNAPLNEVAVGYAFLPRPDLLIPHFGKFWAEIEDEYPGCQHASPIVDNGDALIAEMPLPRVWFISEDNARLVQLQQDRILFNWRDTGISEPYVRFTKIQQEFERVDRIFRAFVEKTTNTPIAPAAFSLTYVNIIQQGEGWSSFSDVGKVFPDAHWRKRSRFLPPPTGVAWKGTFELPDDMGTLTTHVQSATLTRNKNPIFKFELIASSGSLGGKEIVWEQWLDVAHTWIVNAFKDLTANQMHNKVWQLEPGEA